MSECRGGAWFSLKRSELLLPSRTAGNGKRVIPSRADGEGPHNFNLGHRERTPRDPTFAPTWHGSERPPVRFLVVCATRNDTLLRSIHDFFAQRRPEPLREASIWNTRKTRAILGIFLKKGWCVAI
jgi:hypothetical protein